MAEVREIAAGESELAHAALAALRPRWSDRAAFAAHVDAVMRPEGYRLAGVFEEPGDALAVAGFRIQHMLAFGRLLYLDDLSTLPVARRRGHGAALLAWLRAEAIRCGCEQLHLDSGVGAERWDAHRLYLASGLSITSHHFAQVLA